MTIETWRIDTTHSTVGFMVRHRVVRVDRELDVQAVKAVAAEKAA